MRTVVAAHAETAGRSGVLSQSRSASTAGEFAEAEAAYRQASRWERVARPGLAQLWLAQGKVQAALTSARELMEEVKEPGKRAFVLDAAVEIGLAASEEIMARDAAEELSKIAAALHAPLLHAIAA